MAYADVADPGSFHQISALSAFDNGGLVPLHAALAFPTDPRSTRLTLTAAGLDLINGAIPHAMEATERTLSSLSAEERKELLTLLAKLADGEGA